MTERALKIELFDQFARVAQAAASGRRVEIVDVLANGERSVEELSRQVAVSVANTSRHLQVLKEAGLVAATRDGTRVRYRLGSPAVYRFWVALRSLAAERLPGVQGLVDAYLGSREGLEAISGDQLLARLRSGEPLVVVDVRPAEEDQAAHVAGVVVCRSAPPGAPKPLRDWDAPSPGGLASVPSPASLCPPRPATSSTLAQAQARCCQQFSGRLQAL